MKQIIVTIHILIHIKVQYHLFIEVLLSYQHYSVHVKYLEQIVIKFLVKKKKKNSCYNTDTGEYPEILLFIIYIE